MASQILLRCKEKVMNCKVLKESKNNQSNLSFGKSWFLVDLYQSVEFLKQYEVTLSIDSAVNSVILSTIRNNINLPEVYYHHELLGNLKIYHVEEFLEIIKDDPSIVWITLGTSISGCIFFNKPEVSKAIDGRIVGIAGANPFNGGYSGINLYKWDHLTYQNTGSPSRAIAKFYGGLSLQ